MKMLGNHNKTLNKPIIHARIKLVMFLGYFNHIIPNPKAINASVQPKKSFSNLKTSTKMSGVIDPIKIGNKNWLRLKTFLAKIHNAMSDKK